MNGKAKVLKHAQSNFYSYSPSSGAGDLVGQLKFSGSPADMSTIRQAGASFVVNLDGRPVPTITLENDGVKVTMVNDPTPHVVEFFIGGRSVFRRENVVYSPTATQSFSLISPSGSSGSTGNTSAKRFTVTVRGQNQRVTAFEVGGVQYPAAQMGDGTGVYTSDQVNLVPGTTTNVRIIYAGNIPAKTVSVNPPSNASEIELQPQADSGIARCNISPEILQQLGLDASAICNGNKITMSNGAVYRVVVDGDSARLVLEPKEEDIIAKLALPAALVIGGGALLWQGMQKRKEAEAKAAARAAISNPRRK